MSRSQIRAIARVTLVIFVLAVLVGVLGCGKKASSEDQARMKDPQAMQEKQQQMMQQRRQETGSVPGTGRQQPMGRYKR